MQKIRILLTGGGSGGHVYPLLAVANEIRLIAAQNQFDLDIRYFGPRDQFTPILERDGIRVISISGGKLRRYFSIQNFLDIPKIILGFFESFIKIYFYMPDVTFSKGGTGAFPVVFASWFYRVPVVIHESDAKPGLTNLFSAKFAKRIAVSFGEVVPFFSPQKIALTGNPFRSELLAEGVDALSAKEALMMKSDMPLVLVLGGSQGAMQVNELIALSLTAILPFTQVLHQTGQANFESAKNLGLAALEKAKEEERVRYRAVPYLEGIDMKNALAAADVVVGRAGSGTIFELALFGKPAILIPLEGAANDHQKANAYAFAKSGAAIVVEEANLTAQNITLHIKKILDDKVLRETMSAAARAFAKPDAAKVIAQEVLNLA